MGRIDLAGCAIIRDGKLLLLMKRKHKHYEFPGGKVREGETLEEAAIREAREETGCEVELTGYFGYDDFSIEGKDFRGHLFLARISQGTPRIMEPDKFSSLIWMPIQDYEKYPVSWNVREFCKRFVGKDRPDTTTPAVNRNEGQP